MFGSRFLYALTLLIPLIIFGCHMNNHKEQFDKEELNKYIVVPANVKSVAFEMVTLPENNQDDIPGPTDYVSLVAIINFESASTLKSFNELSPEKFFGFPEIFVRNWMPSSAQENFRTMSVAGDKLKYLDVRKIVRGDAKKAIGTYTNAETLILYIEYVSPVN